MVLLLRCTNLARGTRVILLTRFGHSSEVWPSVLVIKSVGSPMGRGQLKYRRRGRGRGGGRSRGSVPDDGLGVKEGTRDIAIFLRDTALVNILHGSNCSKAQDGIGYRMHPSHALPPQRVESTASPCHKGEE